MTIINASFNSKDRYAGVFVISVDSYNVEFQESGVICKNMTVNAPNFRSSLSRFNHYSSSVIVNNEILLDNGTRISHFDNNCKNFAKTNFVYNVFRNNITDGGCSESFSLYQNLSTWVENFLRNDLKEEKVSLPIHSKLTIGNRNAVLKANYHQIEESNFREHNLDIRQPELAG